MSLEDECAFIAMSQDAKYQRFYNEEVIANLTNVELTPVVC
ncbi:hypothetical protein O9992_16490 [Vibrio lentus]|nr:hypothetical protein [Vibrio lentus]